MFIDQTDLKSTIRDSRLQKIIDNDSTVFDQAASEAEAYVKNSLFQHYDTTTIFGTVAEGRPVLVVLWVKRIALYLIYQRIPDEEVPDRIIDNYEETIEYLKAVAAGDRAVDLPRRTETNESGEPEKKTKFRWGSLPQRSH